MGDVTPITKNTLDKYLKAVARQKGVAAADIDLMGCEFFDTSIVKMVSIITASEDRVRAHEILLSLLCRMLGKVMVSSDIHEVPIEFDRVLAMADSEYIKALREWLDDDYNSLED